MKFLTAAIFTLGLMSVAACDANDGPIEEAAEDIDNVIEPNVESESEVGPAVEDAADDISDAAEDVADDVEDTVDTPQ